MTDFVLEVFSEEIPAKMQDEALKNFTKIASELLSRKINFQPDQLKTFISPCRLALILSRLEENQILPAIEKIGPKISAPKQAIQGFLKANNLQKVEQLEVKGEYYVFSRKKSQQKTSEILTEIVPQILQKTQVSWPKLMIWNSFKTQTQTSLNPEKFKWIRPVRALIALFGEEVLKIEYFGLKAGNISFDKRGNSVLIQNSRDYQHILSKAKIEVDQQKRQQLIILQARNELDKNQLRCIAIEENLPILSEVVGMCENPKVLVGEIDQRFLKLPMEALVLSLQSNQKYLCCVDLKGNLASKFLFVIDDIGFSDESFKKIAIDNQKVLIARLTDLQFFIEQDLKKPLVEYATKLDSVVFHQKLGSVATKVKRIKEMAKFLSIFIPYCDITKIDHAANLSKADLKTKAVAEMPELQGKIGSFYAATQGENPEICAAIHEHYLPNGLNSDLPSTNVGVALAVADKIDSIVAFHLINEKPTSSKDPYALRRAALGIIRIALTHKIAFPIRILIEKSFKSFALSLHKHAAKEDENYVSIKNRIVNEVAIFLIERLKTYLKERENLDSQVVDIVIGQYLQDLSAHKMVDILFLTKKTRFVNELTKNSVNSKLIELYKRCANITSAEQKKDSKFFNDLPKISVCEHPAETKLCTILLKLNKNFSKKISNAQFNQALEDLKQLIEPLDDFFTNVLVNDSNSKKRQNRLLILSLLQRMFNSVCDFSTLDLTASNK